MLALRDIQAAFRREMLEGAATAPGMLASLVDGNGLSANERLAVYRNNVFASLTDVLRETFPVICRLVGERFFDYAAHEFIAAHPPANPQLSEYGGTFADFLARFPPCHELLYLADVARFEWLMNEAATAEDAAPVSLGVLAEINPQDAARLIFRLHPSYRYMASPWPVDRIWRANQSGAAAQTIALDDGGVRLEIRRQGREVVFRVLKDTEFAFCDAIAGGLSLGEAIEAALAVEPNFNPGDALAALFHEGAVTHSSLDGQNA